MGEIIRSVCKCGYDTKELFVGIGMCGFGDYYVLGHCKKCKNIQEIDGIDPPPHICKKCKELVSVIDIPNNISYEELSIPCPKCAEYSLNFEETGTWD